MNNKPLISNASDNIAILLEEEAKAKIPVTDTDQILVDAIPYAICWKDNDKIIRGCNSAFREMFNRSKGQCNGRCIGDLFQSNEADMLNGITDSVISNKASEMFIIELESDECPVPQPYEANESPIMDENKVIGTVLTITKKTTPTYHQKKEIVDSINDLRDHLSKVKE